MKYLTYIQSTGTQYIDTGFKPNQNTKIVIDLQPNIPVYDEENFNTWWYLPVGAYTVGNNDDDLFFDIFIENTMSEWAINWSTDDPYGGTGHEMFSYTNNKRITISLEKTKVTLDGDTRNWTTANIQSDITLYLFAEHAFNAEYSPPSIARFCTPMKLYSCQIYDNGTLVRDFYPIEDDNGNIGLYDKVNKAFYANTGTGTFTKGEYTGETTDEPTGGGTTTISSIQFTGLTNNVTYYGKVFTVNFNERINNRADLVYCSAVPNNTPSKITNFVLSGNEFTVSLSWTNPTSSAYSKTIIVQKSGSAPTSLTDGTQVYNGTGTSTTISNLNELTTYYYAAFAVNSSNEYATGFPTQSYTTPSAFPAQPSSYSLINTYTSSKAFTAPEDGWYQVELFGRSGEGGWSYINCGDGEGNWKITGYTALSDWITGAVAGGGAGGGGAYCCSTDIKLNKGDKIAVTLSNLSGTDKKSYVKITSSAGKTYSDMVCMSGGDGGDGYAPNNSAVGLTGGSGGAGGVASGGNYMNKNGGAGATGAIDSAFRLDKEDILAPANGGVAGYTGGNVGGQGVGAKNIWFTDFSPPQYALCTDYTSYDSKKGFCKIYRGNTNITS